jgi:hypothetical protein
MGQQIHCFPLCYGGCALSVQKINFNFSITQTVVYFFQTLYWQGLQKNSRNR